MALTFTMVKKNIVGAQREAILDVQFDNSYPSGGEAFIPNDFDKSMPASAVFWFVCCEQNDATLADNRILSYDYTNKKLMLRTAASTEVAGASDQSAVTIRVLTRYGGFAG